ncbi:MAG: hypothetical protein A3G87_00660 [Omnitrophica bacterium RIFCSPLOWO2_12_FULL_50_11]|nr:MAG: hypothetical protein A3G87_00660 [Omnitrophica bacterium RIFCSPLOWO2_12_FULL_50_11]
MKNIRGLFIAIAIAILAAGGVMVVRNFVGGHAPRGATQEALYYCPMHPTYTSDKPGTCPICGMSLVRREDAEARHQEHEHEAEPIVPREFTVEELVQMKPGEICLLHKCKTGQCMIAMSEEFARLGKCPECGEDLGLAIKNLAPEGYAKLKLGPEKQAILGVETAPVQKLNMVKMIRTVGRIAYDPELYQAQEEYLQALEAAKKAGSSMIPEIREQANKLVESAKIKLRLLGLSEELINEIKTAGTPDRSLLYSDPGGRVWLYAPIYEYELSLVKIGAQAVVEVPGVTGKEFTGLIRSIDSVLDPMTRSARVRAVLENPEGLLKPEMYANATLNVDLGEKLAVPEEAVFATGDKNIVFVAKPDGSLEPREVVLGVRTDDFSEIKSGAGEGERVVTSGNFLIDSESRLKAALQGAARATGSTKGDAGSSMGGHQHG